MGNPKKNLRPESRNLKWDTLKSNNLKKVAYDRVKKEFKVVFNNDPFTIYSYRNVPLKIFTNFQRAESQGNFFATHISKRYTFKKQTSSKII